MGFGKIVGIVAGTIVGSVIAASVGGVIGARQGAKEAGCDMDDLSNSWEYLNRQAMHGDEKAIAALDRINKAMGGK